MIDSRNLHVAAAWFAVAALLIVAAFGLNLPYRLWFEAIGWPISLGAGFGALFGKPLKGVFYGDLLPMVLMFLLIAAQWT